MNPETMAAEHALTTAEGWTLAWAGMPLWLVVPGAALAGWAIHRLTRPELDPLADKPRVWLGRLRVAVVVVLLLLLSEPSLSRMRTRTVPPRVALLLDTSGSMSIRDRTMHPTLRLDEAVALGILPEGMRDTTMRGIRDQLVGILETFPVVADMLQDGATRPDRGMRRRMRDQRDALREALPALSSHPDEAARVEAVTTLLDAAIHHLDPPSRGASPGEGADIPVAELRRRLLEAEAESGGLALRLERLQEIADEEWLEDMGLADWSPQPGTVHPGTERVDADSSDAPEEGADSDSDAGDGAASAGAPSTTTNGDHAAEREETAILRTALGRVDAMSRVERMRAFVDVLHEEGLPQRADGVVFGLSGDLPLLRGTDGAWTSPGRAFGMTDFSAPLSSLARGQTSESLDNLAAVVLLTDGRQTAGGAPDPVLQALRARGIRTGAVVTGDPHPPRDAVIAEIVGNADVFRGETIRMDVRYRVSGFDGTEWRIVLLKDGEPVEERRVGAVDAWQTERFERPAEEGGMHTFTARIERVGEAVIAGDVQGLWREVWRGISGTDVAHLTRHASFPYAPDESGILRASEAPRNDGEHYGQRLRGYVIPPVTGEYVFQICADDAAELWLGTDTDPDNRSLVASQRQYAPHNQWNEHPSQTSDPIPLRAGEPVYIELLHKENRGSDHLQLGWIRPDGTPERPLPVEVLRPFDPEGEGIPVLAPDTELREATLDNNQADFVVTVNEDPLHVLLVDAHPRWDSRYLASLFERDPRVEVTRRYRSIRVPAGEPELLPPTQDELDAFDLILLGDLTPEELAPGDQERLRDFVSRRGGFLVFLAGPRAMPHAYVLGAIADILPVSPGMPDDAPTREDPSRARHSRTLRLTDDGRESPIPAVLAETDHNAALWPLLPPLTWVAGNVQEKIGAQALLVTDDEEGIPILVTGRFGAGRVFYLGTDESWRWRDRLGDRIHQTFWLQAMRWGLGARLRGESPRLQVSLDHPLIRPGGEAEVRARVVDASGQPIPDAPRLILHRIADDEFGRDDAEDETTEAASDTPSEQTLPMEPVPDSHGIWRAAVAGLDAGRYRVEVTVPHPDHDGLVQTRDLLVREQYGTEMAELRSDLPAMQRLANMGGGEAVRMDGATRMLRALLEEARPDTIRRRETRSLWNNYAILLAILALLVVEWIWRKRVGLP